MASIRTHNNRKRSKRRKLEGRTRWLKKLTPTGRFQVDRFPLYRHFTGVSPYLDHARAKQTVVTTDLAAVEERVLASLRGKERLVEEIRNKIASFREMYGVSSYGKGNTCNK